MKSSTSADTVILTDQQGREEVRVIFDNVDTAILHSYYLCKNGTVGSYKTSSVLTSLNFHYLEKIQQVDSFGLLADETSDVSVLEQLIMFVKFVDYELGEPRTVFLSAECITGPSGPNAEVLSESILGVLKEFDLNINKMKSFVSDGASVMTGIHNGVAARLKRVNDVMLNFHCICHRLALACCHFGNETEYIKEVEEILT